MTETAVRTALEASQASWAAVSSGNREAWLALMADDVVIEDPIGPAPTNADGNGVRGKAAVAEFYDTIVGKSNTQIVCEETFPSSSPAEIAHILVLSSQFEGGFRSKVRGVFTYRVDDAGLITNLRGYWNLEVMEFSQPEG
ncbi:hypothetical protein MINS_23460 [Mycolicibacterium insubricum]|jgi:steroid delta-isomerase|uniref:Steroid delta-isomerase n=2 Tax=Mycolicibacterium insubricum TaxID=444597 RepID=A0A1X0DF22_9MYCO|nr:nuclear transport factor 2 family protein [Mycolicibacterium insubricum]MCB9439681.1 nuclear transport factor 2 family protein [Mycolicibacterium sp.]ORA70792.1 steroid delta-isomerase [Mycolicibacterium insubricum]BBZ66917.1 hypothetical protein MINS_23460 [Mycolicibacterium insubricum]